MSPIRGSQLKSQNELRANPVNMQEQCCDVPSPRNEIEYLQQENGKLVETIRERDMELLTLYRRLAQMQY